MIYLDPKSDIAFKKLFGSITHKNILISFLNSILQRPEGSKIVDIEINDPTNVPDIRTAKLSIVDVRCTDQSGRLYIVEMQMVDQKDYAPRAQYYSSIALVRQLDAGESYNKLIPVIFVGILNFELFVKSREYLAHHLILDSVTYAHELKHLEFHFVELPKFTKKLDQLDNILEKWVYFMKNAEHLQSIPASFKEKELTDAFNILAQSNWSKPELESYDRYLDYVRSKMSQIDTAEAKGLEKGKTERSIEIAIKMLKTDADLEMIAELTDLSVEQVKQLKHKQ